jgi:hypothetical protein
MESVRVRRASLVVFLLQMVVGDHRRRREVKEIPPSQTVKFDGAAVLRCPQP